MQEISGTEKLKCQARTKLLKTNKFQKLTFKRVNNDKSSRRKIGSGKVRRSGRGKK